MLYGVGVMRVLLVDDDADLVDLLAYALRRAGHSVTTALDGEQALIAWKLENPDLLLLDGVLPRMDGFEVCRRIRQQADTPIILLTERKSEADVVGGLEAGADDYVSKPFSTRQLLARVHAVMRRYVAAMARPPSARLRVGELLLIPEEQRVTRAGQPIDLTRLEFRLLYYLALNAGHVVPYARLIEQAWGHVREGAAPLLTPHLTRLRRKLDLPRNGPGSISAKPGVGYRMLKS
jgi:DNA-binding response OmpR family regulator